MAMGLANSILIVDDEENIRKYLGQSLTKDGFEVFTAKYGKEGINLLVQKHIDVVLLDLNLPDVNGLDVLKEIKKIDVQAVIIIITAYGEISTAVEATKLGAYEYLTKPFDVEDVKIVINKALNFIGLRNRINVLERQVGHYQDGEIITRSRKMYELFDFIDQIAKTSSTVIIYGETGTGKELIANMIHRKNRSTKKPFVTIDCTSLSENLLESELFGHEKGAFTGAVALKKGLFEIAHGGTVFLDEIGEMPLPLQSKILKVLESKSFRRVGGEKYLETDVQIIAATNRDLKRFVEERRFRKDLYYRLNVVPIYLPSLRERREDIFPLIEYFIQIFNKKIGRNISEVSNEALRTLIDYDWPGNIRELRNIIEHLMILSKGDVIQEEILPSEIRDSDNKRILESNPLPSDGSDDLPDFRKTKKALLEDFEKNYLQDLLNRNKWNISKSARDLDMHRSSLQRLLRKYGLQNKMPQ
jgi:DNA-binding NtrC family response regulator